MYDGGWLCELALQVGTRGGLAVDLIFQVIDGLLLGLHLSLEGRDLVALRLDECLQTTGVGFAGIIRTFPRCLRLARMGR